MAKVKILEEKGTGEQIIPVTKAKAVFLGDGTDTVEGILPPVADKMGDTDTALDTTAQTLVGAINEHESDIREINGNLTKRRTSYTPSFYVNSGTNPTVSNITCYYFTIGNLMVVTGRFNMTALGSVSASNPLRISIPSGFAYQNFGVGMAGMVTPPSDITTPYMLRNDNDFFISNSSGSGVNLPTGYYSFLGFVCLELPFSTL